MWAQNTLSLKYVTELKWVFFNHWRYKRSGWNPGVVKCIQVQMQKQSDCRARYFIVSKVMSWWWQVPLANEGNFPSYSMPSSTPISFHVHPTVPDLPPGHGCIALGLAAMFGTFLLWFFIFTFLVLIFYLQMELLLTFWWLPDVRLSLLGWGTESTKLDSHQNLFK